MKELGPSKRDLIAIGTLLIAGLLLTLGLEHVIDVGLYDESNYLYQGVKLLDIGLPTADWAPLYAIWYYLLSLLQPDRMKLYYLNYKLLTVLLPVSFYIFLKRYKLSATAALVISGYLLISYANLPVWPKPAHFSALIVLMFFILATYIRSFTSATLLIAIGALLSSFVRPDFFLAYILLLCLYLAVMTLRFKQFQLSKELPTFFAFALVSAFLVAVFGLPAFGTNGSRSLQAFGQHFSLNWVRWTRVGLSPWTNWEEILSKNFGDAQSIAGAFMNNPPLFLRHVESNALRIIETLVVSLFVAYNMILPVNTEILFAVEGGLVFGILTIYAVWSRHKWFLALGSSFQRHKRLLVHGAFCSIPGLVSALIIFPRAHYLLLPAIFMLAIVAIFLFKATVDDNSKNDKGHRQLLLAGLLITLIPIISAYYPASMSGKAREDINIAGITISTSGKTENVQTIEFIKSLGIEKEVNLLDAEGGFDIYLGDNFHRVAEYEKDTKCNEFLSERGVNMIVLSNTLKGDTRFINDEECLLFLKNYSAFGFERMSIPNTGRELFVKKDLLAD